MKRTFLALQVPCTREDRQQALNMLALTRDPEMGPFVLAMIGLRPQSLLLIEHALRNESPKIQTRGKQLLDKVVDAISHELAAQQAFEVYESN